MISTEQFQANEYDRHEISWYWFQLKKKIKIY